MTSKLILQGRRDSNPQPPVLETGALPIEPLPWVPTSDPESESGGGRAADYQPGRGIPACRKSDLGPA